MERLAQAKAALGNLTPRASLPTLPRKFWGKRKVSGDAEGDAAEDQAAGPSGGDVYYHNSLHQGDRDYEAGEADTRSAQVGSQLGVGPKPGRSSRLLLQQGPSCTGPFGSSSPPTGRAAARLPVIGGY